MITMWWALAGEHVDAWTGPGVHEGAALLEARVGAVVEGSGMPAGAARHWRETFLAPVAEGLRTEAEPALAHGGSWSRAAGPLLVCVSPAP
ncbi:hypothetical protein [Streptomyces sp. NPDC006193]|uniref:hypothetical protein n=1 Tax=Streptomyces sp. NPDC006193 TaxID=3155717 RepID=UPI0033B8AFF4